MEFLKAGRDEHVVKKTIWDLFRKKDSPLVAEEGFHLGDLKSGSPYIIPERQLVHHVEVIAPPEDATWILKDFASDRIQHENGLIFLCFKSDCFECADSDWISGVAQASGRESDLRVIQFGHLGYSLFYNPIQNGTAPEIQKLILNSIAWTDEAARNISNTVLLTVLRGLCEYRDRTGEVFQIRDVHRLLNEPGALQTFHNRLVASHCQVSQALQFLVRKLDQSAEKEEEREKLRELIHPLGALIPLMESEGATYDFNEALDEGRISFFQFNAEDFHESSIVFGKMVLQDLMRVVGERYSEMNEGRISLKPTTLIIDAYESLGVPGFSDFMAWAKCFGIRIVFAHSSSLASGLAPHMESQVGTVIAVGAQSQVNAEYFGRLTGSSDQPHPVKELTEMAPDQAFVVTKEIGKKATAQFLKLHRH